MLLKINSLVQRIYLLPTLILLIITSVTFANVKVTDEERALHLDWIDKNVSEDSNFFGFANGGWQKNNPIPPAYASWSNFTILEKKNLDRLHRILVELNTRKDLVKGSDLQKTADFYFSGMDLSLINTQGIKPLRSEFNNIQAIQNSRDLQLVIAQLQQIGVDAIFGFSSMQDFKNNEKIIGVLQQGGLSLPNRDYYLKSSEKFKKIRQLYLEHVSRMFILIGEDPNLAKKDAQVVMNIETTLAKASMSQIKQRSPKAIYHPINISDLQQRLPNFDFKIYFSYFDQKNLVDINLAMPHFFLVVNDLLKTINLDDWKIYLRWQLLNTYSAYLSKPIVAENFKMESALTGVKQLLPRWQQVLIEENNELGFALGKLYVERYFSALEKAQALVILDNIRGAMRKNLETSMFTTAKTRDAALKKLSRMEGRVGYPSKWRNYSTLEIDKGPYVLNVKRAKAFAVKYYLDKIGKPLDRRDWEMPPQTVNAYYDPSLNVLNIPAGILQAPFFTAKANVANYGAIGFVIGHEISHGFDDQGAQFDAYGNLKNWWGPRDLEKFKAMTNCLVKQFSNYKIEGCGFVQGKLVVGEAMADLNGLTLAYQALRASKAYKKAKMIADLSISQQFFLTAAHIWAINVRKEQSCKWLRTDPHPPAIYRVNGTCANMRAFKIAFSLPESSTMLNKEPCAENIYERR